MTDKGSYRWADEDGSTGHLHREIDGSGGPQPIMVLTIHDPEFGASAIYIDQEDATQIVASLQAWLELFDGQCADSAQADEPEGV